MKDWNRLMEEGTKIEQSAWDETQKYNAELEKLKYFLDLNAISQDTYNIKVQEAWDGLVKAAQATEGYKESLDIHKEMTKVFDETRTSAENYAKEVDRLNYIYAYTGSQDSDSYMRKLEQMNDKFEKTTDKMSEFAVQAAHNIQDSLGNQLYDMMTGNFDNIGQSWAKLLAKMASEAAAAQIGSWLFGDFGTTKQIGGLFGTIGEFFGFGGGKAGGGSAYAGTSYLIGERGPEIFTPRNSGTITPNSQIGGGSINVQNHIHNETGQQMEVDQSSATFDGMTWHITQHIRALKNNVGGFRDATRQLLSGGR